MFTPQKIEELKSTLIHFAREGYVFYDNSTGSRGRIIGIGFKPYWTGPTDSKIHKIEINFLDGFGLIQSYNLYDVIGFEVSSYNGQNTMDSTEIDIDIHLFSENKVVTGQAYNEPYNKVRLHLSKTG